MTQAEPTKLSNEHLEELCGDNGHADPWDIDSMAREILGYRRAADAQEPEMSRLLGKVETKWPDGFWLLGRGKVSEDEPLYGFQVLFGIDEVLADGEGDTPEQAIQAALTYREGQK